MCACMHARMCYVHLGTHALGIRERERHRETERQTDRQTDRERHRERELRTQNFIT